MREGRINTVKGQVAKSFNDVNCCWKTEAIAKDISMTKRKRILQGREGEEDKQRDS